MSHDHSPSDADRALFRQQVAKLKRTDISKSDVTSAQHHTAKTATNTSQIECPGTIDPRIDADSRLVMRKPGLQNTLFKQFRQGKLIVQAQLDLHGLNVTQACRALNQFLSKTHLAHHHCALIIHGKGRSASGRMTLKQVTQACLQQHPRVLGFVSAKPKDGGTGALYVMLKNL